MLLKGCRRWRARTSLVVWWAPGGARVAPAKPGGGAHRPLGAGVLRHLAWRECSCKCSDPSHAESAPTPRMEGAGAVATPLIVHLASASTHACPLLRTHVGCVHTRMVCMHLLARPGGVSTCPVHTVCGYVSFVVVLRGCLSQCARCALRPSSGLQTARRHL